MKPKAIASIGLTSFLCIVFAAIGFWLYSRSTIIDSERHYNITETIENLKAVDARWNEDVLKSRLRLNQNYDPLVHSIQTSSNLEKLLLKNLNTVARGSSQVISYIKDYESKSITKVELVEQFKGENLILRNSFVFIPFSIQKLSNMLDEYKSQINSPINFLYELEDHIQKLLIEFLGFTAKIQSKTSEELKDRVRALQALSQSEQLPENIQLHLSMILNHVNIILRKNPSSMIC